MEHVARARDIGEASRHKKELISVRSGGLKTKIGMKPTVINLVDNPDVYYSRAVI